LNAGEHRPKQPSRQVPEGRRRLAVTVSRLTPDPAWSTVPAMTIARRLGAILGLAAVAALVGIVVLFPVGGRGES